MRGGAGRLHCGSMATPSDFPARGRLKAARGTSVIFVPEGMTYELELQVRGEPVTGPLDEPIEGLIHLQARKMMTVPSGGNFVVPIFGPPRIVQGRVRYLDERVLVVHAGVNVIVALPAEDSALDLAVGPVAPNRMVNATVMPGAAFELVRKTAEV